MKKQVVLTLVLMAVVGFAAVSTKAQSNGGVRANVPFDFTVGNSTVPAGEITIQSVSSADASPLAIKNFEKEKSAFRIAQRLPNGTQANRGKLVFHRYGDTYYLSEVWMPGYNAWRVLKSTGEKARERELRVAKNVEREVVTVFVD